MATKKELLAQSQEAIGEFFKLSSFLLGDDAPEDINELPTDSPYYQDAQDIASEMGLDWEGMSHADSVRVMINMLAEYFAAIRPDDKYRPVLTISYEIAG